MFQRKHTNVCLLPALLGYKPIARNMDTPYRAEVFVLPKDTLERCCGKGEMHKGHQRRDITTLVLRPEHPPITVSANALQVTPELFPLPLGKGLA